ncbi:MAG: pyrroline-5-carboxylate reductase [Pseudooceanicola sp.]
MAFEEISRRGLVLLGCGKMGSAMLAGWLDRGISPESVHVIDPAPSEWVQSTGVHINEPLPSNPAIALIAVKPQMMGDALPNLRQMGGGATLFVSIAAGTSLAQFANAFGPTSPIVRAMPNTPAAVGRAITAIIGNPLVTDAHLTMTEELLSAIGQVVRLDDENQMDAVTAVSGSGPAYVFHLIETLAAAGQDQGLSADLALKLARATVAGAGVLAEDTPESPTQLRKNVTSPGGTTQAALGVLMDPESGFPALVKRAVAAAAQRSKELSNG